MGTSWYCVFVYFVVKHPITPTTESSTPEKEKKVAWNRHVTNELDDGLEVLELDDKHNHDLFPSPNKNGGEANTGAEILFVITLECVFSLETRFFLGSRVLRNERAKMRFYI